MKLAGSEAISGINAPLSSVIEITGGAIGTIVDPILGKQSVHQGQLEIEAKLLSSKIKYNDAIKTTNLRKMPTVDTTEGKYHTGATKMTGLGTRKQTDLGIRTKKWGNQDYVIASDYLRTKLDNS